jgi:ferredoxin
MFASDKVFEKVFIQELAYWTEGMPMEVYNMMLDMSDIQPLPPVTKQAKVTRTVLRDIPDLGYKGLKVLRDIGLYIKGSFEGCTGCERCVQECPESAIRISQGGTSGFELEVASDLCNGTACMRCEMSCPQKCFKFRELQKGLLKA